jgi:hypothetical protein
VFSYVIELGHALQHFYCNSLSLFNSVVLTRAEFYMKYHCSHHKHLHDVQTHSCTEIIDYIKHDCNAAGISSSVFL